MLLRGFTDILRRAVPLLRPGGVVAITTRPFRVDGELIDFPSLTLDAAINAGLDPVQRCVGLLFRWKGAFAHGLQFRRRAEQQRAEHDRCEKRLRRSRVQGPP